MPSETPSDSATLQRAWTSAELRDNPHHAADKAGRVQRMFTSIARQYDLNNRLHSFGRDQAWRRAAVRLAQVEPQHRVLDVACGTGDLAILFARAGVSEVIGLDFTPAMLEIARHKADQANFNLRFEEGDATSLAFDDATFDVVSIAFGLRNVDDPHAALREMRRVLRPGGRLVVLEFSRPRNRVVRACNALYSNHIMPRTASLIARDREGAYRYLPRSIDTFMEGDALRSAVQAAGFTGEMSQHPLTFGVCSVTVARVSR
ncbi:MAG: bifunctional demethylmenaquinone methyltransferase/2-methoxy-6-polyprenyl-1,4-benzoquinol methylase UbiE [Phycisphaerales bacterium]